MGAFTVHEFMTLDAESYDNGVVYLRYRPKA